MVAVPRPRGCHRAVRAGADHGAMRSTQELELALALLAEGHSARKVAEMTGVPRSTIGYWRTAAAPRGRRYPSPEAD